MAMKSITFTVEGQYPFPIDMLRYDSAYPATSDDAVQISAALRGLRRGDEKRTRTVTLRSFRQPTAARWESFGWKVTA
jgi:hypothetical protein